MRYSVAYLAALASLSTASPVPQLSIPSFSIPSFSGFSIPSISMPTGGGSSFGDFSIPSFGGLSAATSVAAAATSTPASVQATATSAAQATGTSTGTVGSDCTAQISSGGSTENGVTDKNCCTELTVIFARGTSELGNVGTISGPPMFESLRNKLGSDKVTVQGVDYAASAAVSHSALPGFGGTAISA